MLTITVPGSEMFNERTMEFVKSESKTIALEHSLVSLSKWESKWKKPFLTNDQKTQEEILDYIKCMTITQNVPSELYYRLSEDNIREINNYIQDSMTATTFKKKQSGSREIITNEILYYQMITLGIPLSCEKWHLNRLLTLIRVCNEKNNPGKKMSTRETVNHYAALNKARRMRSGSRG